MFCFSSLPDSIRAKLKSSVLAGNQEFEVVRRYMDYQKQLQQCAGNDTNSQSRQGLLQTLALLYGATHGLKRPQNLLPASLDLQERKMLKPQTMLNYLAAFTSFVDYCFLFEFPGDSTNHVTMNGAIRNARKAYSTAATKNYRVVAQEMRAKVPSRSLVCARYTSILQLLEKNLVESTLTYKEQQALNFFVLQVRLNTRSGPLLDLNWEEFQVIEETDEALTTDKHKTGKFYLVHLYIQEDQRPLLKKMRDTFMTENGVESKFVFASKKNKVEKSISRHLQQTFHDLFGDNPSDVRFNANSIRKFWERRWKILKLINNISDGVNKAHLAQTAHNEKTAEDVYIGREGTKEDRNQLLSIYDNDLADPKALEKSSEDDEEELAAETDGEASDLEEATPIQEAVQEAPVQEAPLQEAPRVRHFNVRNSLNNSHTTTTAPTVRIAVPENDTSRTSLNSTLGSEENQARKKFERSLRTFRVRAGEKVWTEQEKKACLLFKDIQGTVSLEDVRARIHEGGIRLESASYFRIYNKLKAAARILC